MIIAQHRKYLVRYGVIPEVARCAGPQEDLIPRGKKVILRTHRGLQFGTIMGTVYAPLENTDDQPADAPWTILSTCQPAELEQAQQLEREAKAAYLTWKKRIDDWKLDLQLLDLELTVDRSKTILYILNDRGAESTKLALQAAASGHSIEVQPVSREGLLEQSPTGGGCGTGSCGCSH